MTNLLSRLFQILGYLVITFQIYTYISPVCASIIIRDLLHADIYYCRLCMYVLYTSDQKILEGGGGWGGAGGVENIEMVIDRPPCLVPSSLV